MYGPIVQTLFSSPLAVLELAPMPSTRAIFVFGALRELNQQCWGREAEALVRSEVDPDEQTIGRSEMTAGDAWDTDSVSILLNVISLAPNLCSHNMRIVHPHFRRTGLKMFNHRDEHSLWIN
jgi:hypothetical protein